MVTHTKKLPIRKFADKKITAFLKSTQKATAFIAPAGYGKSTIAVQFTKEYFKKHKAKSSDDIVCLIDGRILFNLISHNPKIIRLANLLEFNPQKSFTNYFREHPEQVKGKFFLLIDGLDEVYYQAEKLSAFIDNLMKIISAYENLDWIKIIITCRPEAWQIFVSFFKNNPYLKKLWFDISFEGNLSSVINVPLLNKKEIKKILEENRYPQSFETLLFHFPEITEIICNPYFLHLFLQVSKKASIHSELELLNQIVYKIY